MLIVVPARGGSKRVPLKNISPLAGVPLLVHTLRAAVAALPGADLVVSTEDDQIAAVARGAGARVVERPPELATDSASTESVLLHVVQQAVAAGAAPVWVMTLPPTSPFRAPATIRGFADRLPYLPLSIDCLMSVTENRGDFWRRTEEGGWARLFPDTPRRQQDRKPLFEENSAIYLTRVTALRETGSILGRRVEALPISAAEGFDINTPADFALAEAMVAAFRADE